MSEFVQGALVAGGLTLAGVLLAQLTNVLLERRGEEASYRVTLYDKRLAVHQQAFGWAQRLGRMVFLASSEPPTRDQAEQVDHELRQLCAWLDANCLYLDPVSGRQMAHLLLVCRKWAEAGTSRQEVSKQVEAAETAVVKGIGLKHIDFKDIGADLRSISERPDVG
jgi:hypothetical protein